MQSCLPSPAVLLDIDLPLPLAFLLGFEWRITTRLRLSVRQRTGYSFEDVAGDGEVSPVVGVQNLVCPFYQMGQRHDLIFLPHRLKTPSAPD